MDFGKESLVMWNYLDKGCLLLFLWICIWVVFLMVWLFVLVFGLLEWNYYLVFEWMVDFCWFFDYVDYLGMDEWNW